jgi:hypothetical protein
MSAHTCLTRLHELKGYRPKFSNYTNEDCWVCGLRVPRVVALTKEIGGMPFLAPVCYICYEDFKKMYLTELVAWELMK